MLSAGGARGDQRGMATPQGWVAWSLAERHVRGRQCLTSGGASHHAARGHRHCSETDARGWHLARCNPPQPLGRGHPFLDELGTHIRHVDIRNYLKGEKPQQRSIETKRTMLFHVS